MNTKAKRVLSAAGLAMLGFLLLAGCDSPWHDIEYRVTGSGSSVFVTYTNSSDGTSQASNCGLPWSYTFRCNEDDHGTVTASIYADGELMKTSTSTGAYVIATADMMWP